MASFELQHAFETPKLSIIDNNSDLESACINEPIKAYAKLEGEGFCYYIRTLRISLGRKAKEPDSVDIPLGNVKSVSRQHAQLFYNFAHQRFEMMVFGKNGAFVNERFIEKGVTVPLENKTKIQIGEVSFIFLLPKTDLIEEKKRFRNNNNFACISAPQQLERRPGFTAALNDKKASIVLTRHEEEVEDSNEELVGWTELSSPEENQLIYEYKNTTKPPYSYASLIAQAIHSAKKCKMTLNEIYTFITTKYPYYQMTSNGWQNSIRHNLSLNKAFIKVLRKDSEPGKGAFWTIDKTAENQFVMKGSCKKTKRLSISSTSSKDEGDYRKKRVKLEEEEEECEFAENSDEDLIEDEVESASTNNKLTIKLKVKVSPSAVEATTSGRQETRTLTNIKTEPSTVLGFDLLSANHLVKTEPMDDTSINEENQTLLAENIPKQSGDKIKEQKDFVAAMIVEEKKDIPVMTAVNDTTTTIKQETNTGNNMKTLQEQLQNTICQHLMDPLDNPLPSSIVQLLPQAIAKLPAQLATQLSATLKSALQARKQPAEISTDTTKAPDSLPK